MSFLQIHVFTHEPHPHLNSTHEDIYGCTTRIYFEKYPLRQPCHCGANIVSVCLHPHRWLWLWWPLGAIEDTVRLRHVLSPGVRKCAWITV